MTNSNHSAFPATEYYDERPIGGSSGLTKRELFAAMALQGFIAANGQHQVRDAATAAVEYADALIKALSKES